MNIRFPKLFKWQQDVMDWFTSKNKIAVIKSRRQVGKSYLCLAALLKVASQQPGCTSIVVEPTLAQSRKLFNDISKALDGSGIIEKSNESLLHLRFINRSEILFKSAEQENGLRSFTVSGILILDECAFIDQEIIDIVLPTTNVHKASIIVTSTPMFCSGWFYNMFVSPDTGNKRSFNWSEYDTSEVLSEEQIEFYRKTYSKNKFTTEILGEFLVDDGSLFVGIEKCVIDNPTSVGNLYMAIDWASGGGGDNTAITIMNDHSELVYVKYFNDKSPTEQIKVISEIIKKFKPIKITVEINSIGSVYFDMLQSEVNMPIKKFNTNNDSKNRIIDKLQAAVENERIHLLRDEELLLELRAYRLEVTKSGKITYNAPSGFKDDLVVSLAICYDSLTNNQGHYSIR